MYDAPTYEEACDLYYASILSLYKRMTHNREDAEDLTQELFLHLHSVIGQFRGEAKFYTWLYRMAVNRCLMWMRKPRHEVVGFDDSFAPVYDDPALQALPDRLLFEKVEALLPAMPAKLRAATLLELKGFSHLERCDLMGIELSASKSRTLRARRWLRERMNREGCS